MQSSQRLDTRQFSQLSTSLEEHMAAYGYRKVDTPVIQPADLFLTRAGDQIIDHLFTFERRNQQYALRPEFTAAAAAMYAQQHHEGQIARWQFSGSVFEDDPSDLTHTYQRFGIGAELFGMAGTLAEAEVIAMAAYGLTSQGIEGWTLTIGHVQLMRHLLSTFQLDSRAQRFLLSHLPALKNPAQGKNYILEILDQLVMGGDDHHVTEAIGSTEESSAHNLLDVLLDATQRSATMGGRTRNDIVRRLLQKRQRAAERDQFVQALDFLEAWNAIDASPQEAFEKIQQWLKADDKVAHDIFHQWQHLIDLLAAYGITPEQLRIQPALARNWDYYTGIVFELRAQNQELGGGGRYDELAHLLGAEHNIPAVGFTYYADQLFALLPPQPDLQPRTITIVVTPDAEIEGVRWSQALRQSGYAVEITTSSNVGDNLVNVTAMGTLNASGKVYTFDTLDQFIADMEVMIS